MAAAMVDHDRVRGRPWLIDLFLFMAAIMANHDRVHGRSWPIMAVVDHGRPWLVMAGHGRSWPVMTGHGCRHGLCNYLSFVAEFMAEAMVDNG